MVWCSILIGYTKLHSSTCTCVRTHTHTHTHTSACKTGKIWMNSLGCVHVDILVLIVLLFSCCHWVVSDSFVTPWTVVPQAPLPTGFRRQEYWSGSPFPSLDLLPDSGIEPSLLHGRQILYLWATSKTSNYAKGAYLCPCYLDLFTESGFTFTTSLVKLLSHRCIASSHGLVTLGQKT